MTAISRFAWGRALSRRFGVYSLGFVYSALGRDIQEMRCLALYRDVSDYSDTFIQEYIKRGKCNL